MIAIKFKTCDRFIYKLNSSQLRKANWDLTFPIEEIAKDIHNENIIKLRESQILRFIAELNGEYNTDEKAKELKKELQKEKSKPRSIQSKIRINCLYKELYTLLFQKDYICVIMNRNSDYDRANKGFKVNGIEYRRFLGTNNGVKKSTIVYVNKELYPELKKRLDNGRDLNKELVPAKLEAYQALTCSSSIPVPEPKGFIVVKDCITFFKEDVIVLDDKDDGEPAMTFEKDYEIEHNASDGNGLMLPSYSKNLNSFLTGSDKPLTGCNTRYAWEKGMLYTFDFIKFAEKVSKTYEVIDAWGDKRDIRDAEVILTTSMLKLWDSYKNWEDYYENCKKNNYQFSITKTTEEKLENIRSMNYQFLQSYKLTDDELKELCLPTINELKDVLGMDYRKSIVYMTGNGLKDNSIFNSNYNYCARALMADKRMINDPFVRRRIWNMIEKRIRMSKHGSININANYTTIAGDPYALCQSMFGLKVTGLLKAGEVYHKYWIDKGSDEIVCFRAPMMNFHNIRKMKLAKNDNVRYWYQYMNTALIYNAWDTSCEAMNGADKDKLTVLEKLGEPINVGCA